MAADSKTQLETASSRAPGKLMLAGEYVAVARKTPTLAVSVPNYLEVKVSKGKGEAKGWTISSKAMDMDLADVGEVPVLSALLELTENAPETGHFEVLSELGNAGEKPGLGSSAALTVAAGRALFQFLKKKDGPSLAFLLKVHRTAQGGKGSGYDVATSFKEGVVLFKPEQAHLESAVESLEWPGGLYAQAYFTGFPSLTVHLLNKFEKWQRENPKAANVLLNRHNEATYQLIDAFRQKDPRSIMKWAAHTQEELMHIDHYGRIGILHGGQGQLLALIEENGAIGRSSGAGGGDCAWALSDSKECLQKIEDKAKIYGFQSVTSIIEKGSL